MKRIGIWYILCSIFMGCSHEENTVILHLDRQIVSEALPFMSGIPADDGSFGDGVFPELVKGREDWQNTHLYFKTLDYPQLLFQAYRAGKVTRERCMWMFNAWGKDTSECSGQKIRSYVALLEGTAADGLSYIVADNNANMDFTDDVPYLFMKDMAPISIHFERLISDEVQLDSSWILPRKIPGRDNFLFWEYRDMTSASFILHGDAYLCRLYANGDAYDGQGCFMEVKTPDTLLIAHLHEYLPLGDEYYRVDSIRSDGRYLVLTKELQPEKMESTQIGFRPFSFVAQTLEGQQIHFPEDFSGKYVLLDFWSTGCGPCRQEISQVYPGLYSQYKEQGFEILGIADDDKSSLEEFRQQIEFPWITVADREAGRQIHKQYRVDSWPTLFLIDPQGKIIARDSELRGVKLQEKLKELFEL